jgi:hypothetical protein
VHFLDSGTADFDDPGLRALHELLIQAYDDEVEALALAGQVGLLRADIARYPKLRFTWQSILEEATKEGQLRRLVDQALQDPTIGGWHVRIREVVSVPSGSAARRRRRPARSSRAEKRQAGQQMEVGDRAQLWEPGSTLAVRFLDGSPTVRARVEAAATEWLAYANLKFAFGEDPNAPIRVSFQREGSWSYQGRACLAVARDEPTINFGWLNDATDSKEVRRVVLHEFGHVLGLQHEQGNPTSTIEWDRAAVYELYGRAPNSWSRETVDRSIFAIWPPAYFPVHKVFDRQSIMMFPQPAEHLLKGRPIGWNHKLSSIDKQFAAALYPLRNGQ